jgi:NAD(P)-dependent dehydrogenase (short-subunit alcohol dehydrogenase family)
MNRALKRLTSRHPDQRVFITGGASGLGLELSKRFAGAGWAVGIFDRNGHQLAKARTALNKARKNARALALEGDVTDRDSVDAAVAEFVKFAGTPDILINSAGVAAGGEFRRMSMDDFVWVMAVNFLGPVTLCQALLPAMRRRKSGLIINISSAAAFVSSPSMSVYSASKAALLSLSETLAGELASDNIQVSVAMPGFFPTPLLKRMRGPRTARRRASKVMEASSYTVEQAATDILKGVARGKLHIVAPPRYRALWRLKRMFPGRFTRRFATLAQTRGD